jgi:putative ABC transport system permease protein
MILNYLKTAFRNIIRNKFYSIINLLGLSVGVAVFLLVFFYVQYEYNFDKHFPKANQIHRITTDMIWENGDVQYTAVSSSATANALKREYPEVLAATRFVIDLSALIERKDINKDHLEKYYEEIFYIDSSFFKVFQLELIEGNQTSAFNLSNPVFLSEAMAKKYFPDESSLGKELRINNNKTYIVKGVFKDLPPNSHFYFQFLVDATSDPEILPDVWRDLSTYTYVLLKKGTDHNALEEKLTDFIIKYQEPYKDLLAYKVQPMLDIHLKSSNEFEAANTFDRSILLIILGIAILILIVAGINYTNLSLAKSLIRAREVGLRKVVGASKKGIIIQFLSESVLFTFFAFITGIVLAEMALPAFNDFTQSGIKPDYAHDFWKLLFLALLIGIVSGSYPGFYISRFQPARVLKGRTISGKGSQLFQKVLVVFQFAVSVILLIGTGVIYYQFNYIKNKDLGFNHDQVLNVYLWNDSTSYYSQELNRSLIEIPGVVGTCLSDHVPGSEPWFDHFWPEGFESHMPLRTSNVTAEYIPVMGLQLLTGRNFSNDFGLDSATCIINEAALKHFGWEPDEVLGKTIRYNFSNSWDEMITSKVIGVVKDYHFMSLHQIIEPVILTRHKKYFPIVSAKIEANSTASVISAIEKKYDQVNYAFPFEYDFLDKKVEELYIIDQKIGKILIWFSILSVFIAGLGLLGLSSYSVEKRVREIGIRKVFGASVSNILETFNKEFIILVIIASLLAMPIGWFAMDQYLQQFVYRINPAWWIFPLSALLAFTWAVMIVSFQAYKYAMMNPAEVLKWE